MPYLGCVKKYNVFRTYTFGQKMLCCNFNRGSGLHAQGVDPKLNNIHSNSLSCCQPIYACSGESSQDMYQAV